MCIGKNVSDSELLNLNDLNLKNCKEVEILGITIDRNLNFKGHIKNICRKAGQKLSALLRISSHINTDKKALLYKSVIKSRCVLRFAVVFSLLQPIMELRIK